VAEPRTIECIARDYQAARDARDHDGMARYQNQEACLVLLTVLERLASSSGSFIHEVALRAASSWPVSSDHRGHPPTSTSPLAI
jgi:hypothetical protein